MSRVQLALNVSDLEASVAFYSKMFGVEPHKRRPGYANFEVADPALKLVLIETSAEARGTGTAAALNHLGVEVETSAQVSAAAERLAAADLAPTLESATTCCYALQDKVWVFDPAGAPWEYYVVKDDNPSPAPLDLLEVNGSACCTPASASAGAGASVGTACC
jgi:catechol 2,3-dioxygenase-like lactoylglutathione lyase family enzyme